MGEASLRTIWKFTLRETTDVQELHMSVGAEILTAQAQAEAICLWAIVAPESTTEARVFAIVGTGHRMPDRGRYISTVQLAGGALVLHVFELDADDAHAR